MSKMKTHKGISKKIRVRNSGSTKIGRVGANHKSGKKPTSYNRSARTVSTLSKADANRIKGLLG